MTSEAQKAATKKYYWSHRKAKLAYKRKWDKRNRTRRKISRAAYNRTHKIERAQYRHKSKLKEYGVSVEQYDRLLGLQGGRCAICRQPETVRIKGILIRLAVDHNHRTGQVRGLLCTRCNPAVGYLQEDPLRARALAVYLERINGEVVDERSQRD